MCPVGYGMNQGQGQGHLQSDHSSLKYLHFFHFSRLWICCLKVLEFSIKGP